MYQSYKTLFKIKWKMYSVGDYTLSRPIPLDGLMIFILLSLPSYFLSIPVAAAFNQPRVGVTMVLDLLLTWMILNWDPQGRPFLSFIYEFFLYLIRSKKRDFTGKAIPNHRRTILYWDAFDLE